ncbi:MAG: hypothetical protein VW362_11620, partial [Candidatus Nanopelagicales bacterium]
ERCYAYYTRALTHPRLREQAPDPHIRNTLWTNGSRIEILPGTNAQTQGGHPRLATYDELEQGRRQPYENAKSMPVEWRDAEGRRHPGQFVAISTRESGMGLMQRAIDEAAAPDSTTRLYQWCAFESLAGDTCRDDATGEPLCDGGPLGPWCEGRGLEADGWRSREELIRVFRRVGRDTWEAQHLCRKPDAKSLIYATFSAANVTEEAEYVPGAGPLYVGYDWGYTDQTAIHLVQYRDGALYQCAEFSGSQRSERDWVRALVRAILDLPGYHGPTFEAWENIWAGNAPWPDPWPSVWPDLAAGDPSAVQFRAELKAHGIATAPPAGVRHEVESGQDVLRAAFGADTLTGRRRYYVHPRCRVLIHSLSRYRARELADGSFDPRPDPDPANHAYSHAPDAARYLVWRVRRLLGLGAGRDAAEEGA